MLRNLLFTLGIILTTSLLVFPQVSGTLKGKVIDKETNEPLPFVNIVVEIGGTQVGGGSSDFDGNYIIKPIPPGKYDVKATYVGYKPLLIRGVIITANSIRFYDIKMESTAQTLETFEVIDYKVPLINKDQTTSGGTVTAEEIAKMPNRQANAVAATIGGVFTRDGTVSNIRGARGDATAYYIDGIRVRGSSTLPPQAIEQVTVILGGTPAQYGDATGGIIDVTTKGPSRKFGAGIELETSQFLDPYGYNRVGLNLNGPLFSRKDKDGKKGKSLLGYFIAGDFTHREARTLYAKDKVWKAEDSYLNYIQNTPLRPSGLGVGTFLNAEYTRTSDLERTAIVQNNAGYSANLSGKIDVRTTPTVNLTFGGSLNYNHGRTSGGLGGWSNALFNYDKNPLNYNYVWRVFGRFTQRFPTERDSKSMVKNVYYSIQADYSRNYGKTMDADHKENIFKYGYVGKFESHLANNYELGQDTVNGQAFDNVWIMNNIYDTLLSFTPSNMNQYIANVTQQFYDFYPQNALHRNSDQIELLGAKTNGQQPDGIYGMYSSPGAIQSGYNYNEANQLGITASGAMDIGNHEIKFGLQYEQRSDRGYGVASQRIWTLMDDRTNFHIGQLDVNNPILVYRDGVFMDTINYTRLYDQGSQTNFDIMLRQKLGLPVDGTDFISIDSYDFNNNSITYFDANNTPHTVYIGGDLFDINMFTADELFNDGIGSYVGYYGYDHTGEKYKGSTSLNDFWNKKDANGYYERPIGAFEPIYMAGYIQDKFAFKDLIFNIGVRIDRFDANQEVLKDPYLFYRAYDRGAMESIDLAGSMPGYVIPSNIGNDYIVYVDDPTNPTTIVGYRLKIHGIMLMVMKFLTRTVSVEVQGSYLIL